jgi:hypothetical protein
VRIFSRFGGIEGAGQLQLTVPSQITENTIVVFENIGGASDTRYELPVSSLAGYQNQDVWQFGPSNIVSGTGDGCGSVTWSVQGDFNPLP